MVFFHGLRERDGRSAQSKWKLSLPLLFRLFFFSLIFCFSSFIDFKFSLFFHLSLRFVTRIHNSWIFGFWFSIYLFFFVFLLLIFHYSQVYNPSSSSCTKFVKIFITNPLFFFFQKIQFRPNLRYGFYGILLYQNHRFLDILVLLWFFFFFFLYLLLYSSFSLCLQIYGFIFINRVIHKLYNF